MNYFLDFVIVTPQKITMFDQGGIFTRSTRALDTTKIKTINVVSQGWLSSIFNFGSIVFLAEGDVDNGEIMLRFIGEPILLRDSIYKIIALHDEFEHDE